MAQTTSKIKLLFEGAEKGVVKAAKQSAAAIKELSAENDRLALAGNKAGLGLISVGKGLAVIGSAGSAVSTVGAAAGAVAQLAPAALLLPGALLAGAAAMGTFKIATQGFGDAISSGLSGDLEAFAEATKKMHPEMAKAAGEVVKLKPRLDDLKKTVQGRFWDGFAKEIGKTANNVLPALTRELPGIADGFNAMGKSALKAMQTGFFKSDVQTILYNTGKTLKNMGSVTGDVLTGFVRLGSAGSSYLPRLGKAIDNVATKFANWAERVTSEEDGSFRRWVDGAIQGFKDLGGIVKNVGSILGSVFRGLGTDMGSPLATLKSMTGQVAEFLKTASAQEGLKELGTTLRVIGEQVGRVVMTALRELMPIIKELAPVAREVAVAIGDWLVGAIETVGPILRGLARTLSENKEEVARLVPIIATAVVAIKGLQIATSVAGWLKGATTALGLFSAAAKAAGTDVDGLGKKMDGAGKKAGAGWLAGFKGALGAGGAGVAGTLVADALIPKDVTWIGSQAARDMLGEMARVFSGEEGNVFKTWEVARWISSPMQMAGEVGRRELMKLFGFATSNIPELKFDVNAGPAQQQVGAFLNQLKGTSGTVNMNGRTVDAAQALADIVQRINAGQGEVDINGTKVPAQQALTDVIGQINRGAGTVTVNGRTIPAGQALADILARTNRSSATINVGANTSSANGAIAGLVNNWNGRRINLIVTTTGSGGIASAGRLAAGGPVQGPGTGTSDTAGLFALSNGEHVLTAREVANAGGHDAVMRWRERLAKGPIRGLADGGGVSTMRAAMRAPRAAGASGATRIELVVSPGGDEKVAALINYLGRTGKLNARVA